MIPLTPAILIATANGFVGFGEVGGNNKGPLVEEFLRGVGQPPGQPWCAAFVHHVGNRAHYDWRTDSSSWPLPATASCWELGEFARAHGVLVEAPAAGDVFLEYSARLERFAHTGIVAGVVPLTPLPQPVLFECVTIEGNTNAAGSRTGDQILRRRRHFLPGEGDRFIRWVDLAPTPARAAA